MVRDLLARRDLVWAFARRDRAIRFRGSALGWLWSLGQPIATLIFLSIVFTTIFPIPPPPMGNEDGSSYAAFLFCGLVVWNLFSGLQLLSIQTLRSCGPLLGRVSFPGWTAVVGAQLVQALQVLAELAVLALLLLLLGNVGWSWLAAIPILVGALMLGQGVGLVLSVLSARLGDVRELVIVALGLLYFATPILYPMSALEGQSRLLLIAVSLNPVSWYVQAMHDAMYSLVTPSPIALAALLVGGAVALWLGLKSFAVLGRDLAEFT